MTEMSDHSSHDDTELHEGERLQKILAALGWGSRRVCEDLIIEDALGEAPLEIFAVLLVCGGEQVPHLRLVRVPAGVARTVRQLFTLLLRLL